MVTQNISSISRLLYLDQIYRQIVDVPGVICEFGVHWGAGLAQLINLRAIHEPFNHSRTICGFDTFEGFPSVHAKDGGGYRTGDLATLADYEVTLERILALIESFPPQSHLRKFELIKGDACQTIDPWLEANPHAVVSLAIFDAGGRRVRALTSGAQPEGQHAVAWDLRDGSGSVAHAGVYFARLEVEGHVLTRKFAKLK